MGGSDRDLSRSERRASRAQIHKEESPAVTPREYSESPAVTPREYNEVPRTSSITNGHFAAHAAEGRSYAAVASPRMPVLQMTDTLLRRRDDGVEAFQNHVTNGNSPSVSHARRAPEPTRISALSPRARVHIEPLAALR